MIYESYDILHFIIIFLCVVISITLHEYAHARVALWNGDYTAKAAGRLTLNPLKHFDPIGFFMLMIAGFGYAKPVPVNPYNFKRRTRGIFTVAIAGVTVNILLAFISAGFLVLINKTAVGVAGGSGGAAAVATSFVYFFFYFFYYMLAINVSLFLFNLIPLYPLDGFRVVEAFTRYSNPVTRFLREYGRFILLGLIGIHILIDALNLIAYWPGFMYVDLFGLYIGRVGLMIRNGFIMFWGLF
ncbi:MAG: site-2 protease family protein [Clostridiales bacterium]|nr:site-2 protease family protein [Clostridiales bacterium]